MNTRVFSSFSASYFDGLAETCRKRQCEAVAKGCRRCFLGWTLQASPLPLLSQRHTSQLKADGKDPVILVGKLTSKLGGALQRTLPSVNHMYHLPGLQNQCGAHPAVFLLLICLFICMCEGCMFAHVVVCNMFMWVYVACVQMKARPWYQVSSSVTLHLFFLK